MNEESGPVIISSLDVNAMKLPFSFRNARETAAGEALVDSGATESFIDYRTAIRWRVGVRQLKYPRRVYNVDGTLNQAGTLTECCFLRVRVGKKHGIVRFFVTNLGTDRILLGYPWLKEFDPPLDWKNGRLKGDQPITIETLSYRYLRFRNPLAGIVKDVKRVAEIGKTQLAVTWKQLTNRWKKVEGVPDEYQRHKKVFSEKEASSLPPSRPEDHAIKLKPGAPDVIQQKIYPLSTEQKKHLKEYIDDMLKNGKIEPSDSPWAVPMFFVKKSDGKLRPVQDYRKVNEWTVTDSYPLPRIDVTTESFHGLELFTKMDWRNGFWNFQVRPEDRWKAAFRCIYGCFQPTVMPFGLKNAPATMQRGADRIFARLKNKYPGYIFCYMDDILIGTPNDLKLHQKIVHEVLDLLEKESIFLKPSKCEFEKDSIEFLGIKVEKGKIMIDPTKRKGLAKWPKVLKSVKEIRSTLGVLGYQRPFI